MVSTAARFPEGQNPEVEARTARASEEFKRAMEDDLNTSDALGATFEFIRDINTSMDAGEFRAGNVAGALRVLSEFDAIFDVLKPSARDGALSDELIDSMIAERNRAKKSRDFARADAIRSELLAQGVVIEDTKDGVRWKRKQA